MSLERTIEMPKLSGTLAGTAGQYFVAGELSRRGYVVAVTLRNAKGIDLLVSNPENNRQVGIQVKTTRSTKARWLVTKNEIEVDARLIYIFVNLKADGQHPDFSVVPSKDVAAYVKKSVEKSLSTLRRDGLAARDSGIREFRDPERTYRDRWELLGV